MCFLKRNLQFFFNVSDMSFVIYSNSSPFLSMNTAYKRSQRFHELEKQTIINMDNQGFNSPTIGKALNVSASRILEDLPVEVPRNRRVENIS